MSGGAYTLKINRLHVILSNPGKNRVPKGFGMLWRRRASLFRDTAQDGVKVAPKIQSNSVQAGVLEFSPVEDIGLTDSINILSAAPTSGGGGPMSPPTNIQAIPVTEEVTTFYDELPPVEEAVKMFKMIDTNLLSPVESDMSRDIKRFLSRPTIVAETTISTTQTALTSIYSEEIPKNWLYSTTGTNLIPMWQRKIEGFSVIRGTIKIRVQINAQRFQQGRFLLVYFPQAAITPERAALAMTQSLTLATQLPRVELDCAANSSATLTIPYVSPTLGYEYVSGEFGHGTVNLLVYSPLVDPAGTGTIGVTVWASWDDVELMFPCQPQSGGRRRGGAIQEQEEGSFTRLFKSVSKVATVASEVPVLSAVAKPVGWAADIAGKVASAFGWANPRDTQRSQNAQLKPAPYNQNVDGIDESQILGFSARNITQVLPGAFGNDRDEMSILDIVRRHAYIGQFNITTALTAGTNVYTLVLRPDEYVTTATQTTTGVTITYPSPIAYVFNAFTLWRGSTELTFKFVKTEFHSIRVMIVYTPPQAPSPNYASNEYAFREIYDVRETNEIKITVPFVSSTQYIDRNVASFSTGVNAGRIDMYIVNELKAPTTVSDTITVLVEVAGGADTEFAVPTVDPHFYPGVFWKDTAASLKTIAPGFRSRNQANEVYVLQALGTDLTQTETTTSSDPGNADAFGSTVLNSGGLAASAYCIGEKIISLRQLLKRSTVCYLTEDPTTHFDALPTVCASASSTSATTYPIGSPFLDYWNYFAPLFQYRRGGVRLKLINVNSTVPTGNILWGAKLLTDRNINRTLLAPFDTNTGYVSAFSSHALAYLQVAGGIEVESPYYSMTHIQVMRDMAYYSGFAGAWLYPNVSDMNYVQFTTSNTFGNTQIWRQAADDTEFGFFVGVYPMLVNTPGNFSPVTYFV